MLLFVMLGYFLRLLSLSPSQSDICYIFLRNSLSVSAKEKFWWFLLIFFLYLLLHLLLKFSNQSPEQTPKEAKAWTIARSDSGGERKRERRHKNDPNEVERERERERFSLQTLFNFGNGSTLVSSWVTTHEGASFRFDWCLNNLKREKINKSSLPFTLT